MSTEPHAFTPGPWVLIDDYYLRPATASQSRNVARIATLDGAMVYRNPESHWEAEAAANRRLITQAPRLFDFVQKMHAQLLEERDCFYEGCANLSWGLVDDPDDRESLAAIDADIDEAKALLDAVTGEGHADEI